MDSLFKFLTGFVMMFGVATSVALPKDEPVHFAVARAAIALKTSLVMIDTGNSDTFTGTLNMEPSTCDGNAGWCFHGKEMAHALEDQLKRFQTSPIKAVQLPWKNESDILKDLIAATVLKPRVITMSLSGSDPIKEEKAILDYVSNQGILVLIASGNRGKDQPDYPSAYKIECQLSVSTTLNGVKPHLANSGDIYIPIYGYEGGTSYSAARAGAYAIRYFQEHPKATCQEAKAYLINRYGHL